MSVSLLVSVIETDRVIMEVTVYSIHQLLTTLVIVLVLDMRESTVLVSNATMFVNCKYNGMLLYHYGWKSNQLSFV